MLDPHGSQVPVTRTHLQSSLVVSRTGSPAWNSSRSEKI